LEYLAAASKPRFVFLLAERGDRLPSDGVADEDGEKIAAFRNRLKTERWVGLFSSPDELAKQAVISLSQYDSSKRAESLAAMEELRSAPEVGPSYMRYLRLVALNSAEFVTIGLGPIPWWNTRLHLAAALASDFTEIRGFIIQDEHGRFLLMASPTEIRRALTKAQPKLEQSYMDALSFAPPSAGPKLDWILMNYADSVRARFGVAEMDAKEIVSSRALREMGVRHEGEAIERTPGLSPSFLNAEIVKKHLPFVVRTSNGVVEGVVDRVQLVTRLARFAVSH
jgi:hypothetical protein